MPDPSIPTTAEAVRAVRGALGDRAADELRPIDEGGEHASWWAGADHVVRFALDEDGSLRQRRELAVRDLVRPTVGVALPVSVASGSWAPGRTYTVDTRLAGRSAERRAVGAAGEADLARLLSGLRAVAVDAALAIGVPRSADRALDDLARRAREAGRQLVAAGELDGDRERALEAGLVVPDALRAATPAVLRHGDLKGEHLLLDEAGGVVAVLDWTDAAVGDPAADVAGLAISIGAGPAARVAERAGCDESVRRRGGLLARADTLILLDERLAGRDDSPLALLRVQLERAWEAAPTG